jgi:hypothetical protein
MFNISINKVKIWEVSKSGNQFKLGLVSSSTIQCNDLEKTWREFFFVILHVFISIKETSVAKNKMPSGSAANAVISYSAVA